jgi:hypothetical protein
VTSRSAPSVPRRWAGLALLGAALAGGAWAGESPLRRLPADGSAITVEVKAVGDKAPFVFAVQSGCRYRLTVEPLTLERPVIDLTLGDGTPQRFGAPERGKPAVHEWDAEGDGVLRAEVAGFSALIGTAKIRLEAIGPDGTRQAKPKPWLAPTKERARVGDLMLGEADTWDLAVEPGAVYELEPTRGSAPGVSLRVLAADSQALAAGQRPWLPFDALRFKVPPQSLPLAPPPVSVPGAPPAPPTPWKGPVLEVRGLRGSGGTYGLRLTRLADDEPLASPPSQPPPPVERGVVPGAPLTFRANPGDLVLLATLKSSGAPTSARMQAQVGGAWADLGFDAPLFTMQTQEGDHLAAFRPEQPGTYRFTVFAPERGAQTAAVPLVVPGDDLGGAPLLMGVPSDPTVRAKLTGEWKTIGLAAVLPTFDYLYVGVDAATEGVGMRVRDMNGKVLVSRSGLEEAGTIVPGMGPSLRFRAKTPGLLRLEAKGASKRVYALLRRASN